MRFGCPLASARHTIHDIFGNVIAELNATGATVREYIYLPEAEIAPTRGSRTTVDRPIAVVDAVNTTPVTLYVHVDHLHRPVRMTNAAKATVWDVIWTPWGAPHTITGAQTLNARFPGQWFQLEAGLHYNWHRHYDPSLGRYTQPDPLGFVDGPSVYAYARNTPLQSVDRDGQNAVGEGIIKGGQLGARICGGQCAAAGAVIGGAIGAGIVCAQIYKEAKRCTKVRKECYEKCSELFPLPKSDQGMRYFRCVEQCLFDNKCGGTDYSND